MKPGVERTIGRLLRSVHAGERHLTCRDPRIADAPASILLTSPAFADGSSIPTRHAGSGVGDNISPALAWASIPEETAELVLIVQDPDAPLLRPVTHLIAMGLAPSNGSLPEGALAPRAGSSVAFGLGSFGRVGYAGPRPVRGHGLHRYVFQMFALDHPLSFPVTPTLAAVVSAMARTVLSRGMLTGTYERT
jgi:Raf kinase inhibitor-like YbhB/YbcL family protein